MSTESKLREVIRELIKKELEEANSNASVGNASYKTPHSFAGSNKKGKRKKKAGYSGGSYDPTIGTDNELAGDPKLRKESVNEGKKQYAQQLTDNFFKSVKKFEREVIVLAKMATKIRGDRTDEKIILKMYKKHMSPFLELIKSWNNGTQKNPGINEGRYHDFRNDEELTPKQKIGMAMRETRDGLKGLEKTIDMNLRLKTELNVDSRDYWKNTHKALKKISERLVKLAGKVGQLR